MNPPPLNTEQAVRVNLALANFCTCHLGATLSKRSPPNIELMAVALHASSQDHVEAFLNSFIHGLYAFARGQTVPSMAARRIISDAALVDTILRAPDRFQKNYGLVATLGLSRFTTDGDQWRRRRDLTQAAYTGAGRSQNRRSVAAAYEEALARCDSTTPQAIRNALLTAASGIFFQAFGSTAPSKRLLLFCDTARPHVKRLQYYSWISPSAAEVSGLRAQTQVLLRDFADELLRSSELRTLLQGFESRGDGIENFGPVEEFLTNLFGGVETTTATLGFAIDRLGIDARVQERLLQELEADECPYLECFINETMRYFPPVPFVVRQVASDTTIGNVKFEAGQLLILSIVGIHHNPHYWKEPEIFDCSRAEFLQNTYDRSAFIPFLAGPRMCGGAKLARLELTEGLKAFIRRFKVERKSSDVRFDYGLALRPNSWELVEISLRS